MSSSPLMLPPSPSPGVLCDSPSENFPLVLPLPSKPEQFPPLPTQCILNTTPSSHYTTMSSAATSKRKASSNLPPKTSRKKIKQNRVPTRRWVYFIEIRKKTDRPETGGAGQSEQIGELLGYERGLIERTRCSSTTSVPIPNCSGATSIPKHE